VSLFSIACFLPGALSMTLFDKSKEIALKDKSTPFDPIEAVYEVCGLEIKN